MHDIMRSLGVEEDEQLTAWPVLIKMPLDVLDGTATRVVQLLVELITSVSGSDEMPAEERITLRRVVGELVVAANDGPTIAESDEIMANLSSLGTSENVTTKRYMQSVVCKSLSFRRSRDILAVVSTSVNEWTSLGEYAFTSRRADYEILASGRDLEPALKYVRLKQLDVRNALEFIQNNCDLSWRNGHIVSRTIGSERVELPRLKRHLSMEFLFGEYNRWAIDRSLGTIGRHEFYSLLRIVSIEVKEVTGASYYFTDGVVDAFKMIRELLARVNQIVSPSESQVVDRLVVQADALQYFVKYELKSHLDPTLDGCVEGFHCVRHAVNGECSHEHQWTCLSCSALDQLCADVCGLVDRLRQQEGQHAAELESMIACLHRVGGQMFRYVKHAVRAVWQHARIADTMISTLSTPETKNAVIFVDLDHKQKMLGRKLIENQVEYFGKVGMSLLGAMVMSAANDEASDDAVVQGSGGVGVLLHFVDMIVNNGAQDVFQVISCLETLIAVLHDSFPDAKRMVLISDNASVFTGGEWIPWVIKLTRKYPYLRVSRYMNTEAQTGRDMLDAHFSFLNRKVDAFVRKDNAVQTPEQLFAAITDDGGIANTTTLLVNVDMEKASLFNAAKLTFSAKVKSASRKIHDTVYDAACDTVSSGATPMCRIFTNSGVPNSVMTDLVTAHEARARAPRFLQYVCPHTHAEQVLASVVEKTLSSHPHSTPSQEEERTTLTGVAVLKQFSSPKPGSLRKSLTQVLASERTTDIASTAEGSLGQTVAVVRCPQCSKRYSSTTALRQHEPNCSEYVFRDKNEMIAAALREFFTVSKQIFAESRARLIVTLGRTIEPSPRRSRRNWADKESVNEFTKLPLSLKETIKSFFFRERKCGRKVKPHHVVEFLKISVITSTDWDVKFLLTEQRLKTELSRLAKE